MNDPFEFKKKLDTVGPGFCLAKWETVTLHLHNGTTHSCYHPPVHPIPLEELEGNPSAIHNTKYKKLQRKLMLEGKRPKECSFCWNIEDSSKQCYSDRLFKSATLTPENFEKVKNSKWDDNYIPSHVEVSFSSLCNLACCYCNPIVSSRYMDDIKRNGAYQISVNDNRFGFHHLDGYKNRIPYDKDEDNPYVKAFWDWWPELYPALKTFRITGGEPLINKNTYMVLDKIIENPSEKLEQISINSNLSIPNSYLNIFLKYLDKIKETGKDFLVYSSLESVGKQAEYARYGLNYNKWVDTVTTLIEKYDIKISIMCTYNALSVSSFLEFLKLARTFKQRYPYKFYIDVPYLELPKFMSVLILEKDYFLPKLKQHIDFVVNDDLFNQNEKNRIIQVYDFYEHFSKEISENEMRNLRRSFYLFFRQYDKRRNVNFLETFPEYEEFYNRWGNFDVSKLGIQL